MESVPSDNMPPPKANNSKRGGRGARSKRADARRTKQNAPAAQLIDSTEKSNLHISSLTISYKPSYGEYSGGVAVEPFGLPMNC
jgi:hypothetical protein